MTQLKIGELARLTSTRTETLRYYETEGLLPPAKRTPAGYRIYADADVQRVSFIRRARSMGFSLREVAELMSLQVDRASSTCGEVKQLAQQKLVMIDQKLTELRKMQSALQKITEACEGGEVPAERCTILNALEH